MDLTLQIVLLPLLKAIPGSFYSAVGTASKKISRASSGTLALLLHSLPAKRHLVSGSQGPKINCSILLPLPFKKRFSHGSHVCY